MVPDDALQLAFRWVHVLAAVLWVGALLGHEWALKSGLAALDEPTRRRVLPALLPRVLFWSRWSSAATWLSGVSLMMVLYYSGRYPYLLLEGTRPELGDWFPAFAGLLLGYFVYDLLFRVLGSNVVLELLGALAFGAAVIGFGCWLDTLGYSSRARTVHLGALLATAMAGNVWLRLRPAYARILSALERGEPGDARAGDVARLRTRHNATMAFPTVLLMLAVDQPGLTGAMPWQGTVAGVLVLGAVGCWLAYAGARSVRGR